MPDGAVVARDAGVLPGPAGWDVLSDDATFFVQYQQLSTDGGRRADLLNYLVVYAVGAFIMRRWEEHFTQRSVAATELYVTILRWIGPLCKQTLKASPLRKSRRRVFWLH